MRTIKAWVYSAACACAFAAHGQTVSWQVPAYAQGLDPGLIHPFWALDDLPQNLMQYSAKGAPGFILAGGAQVDEDDGINPAVTPYVTKIDVLDGHALWSWQPVPGDTGYGRIWALATDGAGNILVSGSTHFPGQQDPRPVIGKIDGANGETIWLASAPDDAFGGYQIAADANGDVFATTFDEQNGQRVLKYAAATGNLVWSNSLSEASDILDDLRLTLDPEGNVIVGGYYSYYEDPQTPRRGTQIGKFDGADGAPIWRHRTTTPSFGLRLISLQTMSGGDVVSLGGDDGIARLSGVDGRVLWQHTPQDIELLDLGVDGSDRLFSAGSFFASNSYDRAAAVRFDPNDGGILWQTILPSKDSVPTHSRTLAVDGQQKLLVGWNGEWGPINLGVSRIEPETGVILWSTAFGPVSPNSDGGVMVDVRPGPNRAAYVGTIGDGSEDTWVMVRIDDAIPDSIFISDFEQAAP